MFVTKGFFTSKKINIHKKTTAANPTAVESRERISTPTPNERSTRVSSRDASTARWVGSAGAGGGRGGGRGSGTMGLRRPRGCATSSRWPPSEKRSSGSEESDLGEKLCRWRSARRRWPRRSGREGWTGHCSRPQAAAQAGEGAREGAEAAVGRAQGSRQGSRRRRRRRRRRGGRPETTRSGEPMFVSAGGWTTTKTRASPGNARRRASSPRRTSTPGSVVFAEDNQKRRW